MNRKLPTLLVSLMLATGAAACGDGNSDGGEEPQNQAPQSDEGTNDPAEGLPAPEDGGQNDDEAGGTGGSGDEGPESGTDDGQ